MADITQIIGDVRLWREHAVGRLLAVVEDELHRLAARKMAQESPGHTLQTTALVHEAYLRFTGGDSQVGKTRTTPPRPGSEHWGFPRAARRSVSHPGRTRTTEVRPAGKCA